MVKVSSEVSDALSSGRAVVALESTIISHGNIFKFCLFISILALNCAVYYQILWSLIENSIADFDFNRTLNFGYVTFELGCMLSVWWFPCNFRDALPSKFGNSKGSGSNCQGKWSSSSNHCYFGGNTMHRYSYFSFLFVSLVVHLHLIAFLYVTYICLYCMCRP